MIEFKQVTKKIQGNLILKHIDLKIKTGQLFSFVGPSGSGKTTLLKLINGLYLPNTGDVLLDGISTRQLNMQQKRLQSGYVLQNSALFPNLTVEENIMIQLIDQGYTQTECKQQTQEALQVVQLDQDYLHRYPSELSGGQKQRVAIARALVGNPKLILFDESFSALDPLLREQLQDLVLALHQNKPQLTIIFVTHDMTEAMKLSDEIAILKDGVLQQVAAPEQIKKQPANSFVAELFKTVQPKSQLKQLLSMAKIQALPLQQSFSKINKIADLAKLPVTEEYCFNFQNQSYCLSAQQLLHFLLMEADR